MAMRKKSNKAAPKRLAKVKARAGAKAKARAKGKMGRARKGKAEVKAKRARPQKLIVRRTSGRTEKFDKEKMAQTMSRSGTPFMMARDVAKTVSRKISKNKKALGSGREVEIDGSVVREMVADELRNRNRPDIASSLTGESPENTRQGRHEMANENEPVLDGVAANRTKLLFDNSSRSAKSTKAA
jgi:transcriptional regulator NrdR family protein